MAGKSFENSAVWLARAEMLLQYTNRPSLIRPLLDLEGESDKTIRRIVEKISGQYKIERRAAKGRVAVMDSSGSILLRSKLERYHVSILYSIAEVAQLAQQVSTENYLEYIIEVYQRYLSTTRQTVTTAVVDFDTYCTIIMSAHLLAVHNCNNCGSVHVSRSADTTAASKDCPFCSLHDHGEYRAGTMVDRFQHKTVTERRTRKATA